jgi:hypothetical protein
MAHSPSYRRILHKMGYYDYQQGLIYRHLNQKNGWDSHLEHCRNFILKAIDLINPEKITVYGSGWLLELPLAEMDERVKTIILADIVHPPEVISQTAKLKNVKLVEEDVSGGLIEEVWKIAGKRTFLNKLTSLKEILIPEYQPVEDPGMVISLNILTQLEVLPEKLLRKKTKASGDELTEFKREIQEKHIRFLKNYKSVLITDFAEIFTDLKGGEVEQKTIVTTVPDGKVREEWIWDFDLLHADYNKKRSVFKVVALIL